MRSGQVRFPPSDTGGHDADFRTVIHAVHRRSWAKFQLRCIIKEEPYHHNHYMSHKVCSTFDDRCLHPCSPYWWYNLSEEQYISYEPRHSKVPLIIVILISEVGCRGQQKARSQAATMARISTAQMHSPSNKIR